MIGRFIQQQEAGLLQQELGQGNAHLPPAAEFLAWPRKSFCVETQPEQNGSGLGLDRIAFLQAELLGNYGVAFQLLLIFGT